ncbi:DUF4871 domain-containing protein [Aquibacillus albus]|uniref:DUF4871 domain-containing protein n=1 Tax=Aquibacillus albus TaxID=1168171 RepID=A0ABS2N1D2_9BACI|nr:DUF4871 domain-containing protein [Aquibacillus albus]MBM7571930.1 hypothetical protein [Aquibacillus albus]
MTNFEEMDSYDDSFKSMKNKVYLSETEKREVFHKINMKIERKPSIRKQLSIKWKYRLALSSASFILMILIMPFLINIIQDSTGNLSKDESIRQIVNELDYDTILHQEEVNNGVVVFYIPNIETDDDDTNLSELSAIFIKKTLLGWEGTNDRGGYSSNIGEDITSQYLPKSNRQSPFPMLYGEINNQEVDRIKVINLENNAEYHAETVIMENHHIWFVFLDEMEEGKYEIQGLSETNEMITSITVDRGLADATINDDKEINVTPNFVNEKDFETIDWERKANEFGDNRMTGNKNKSGVIGADMPSLSNQKWMWHLWGIENPQNKSLTVVGFHKESETVHQILTNGWTIGLSGPNNGADAHTPSTVKIPDPGEWAILLYINEELFDVLVYEINE